MKLFVYVLCCFVAGTLAKSVDTKCNHCQSVVSTIQQNFQNASKASAYQNFVQICNQGGKLSNACKKISESYFDELFKYFGTRVHSNEFCFKAEECSTNAVVPVIQILKSIPKKTPDDPACELCEMLVKNVVSELTEDNFHELLVTTCKGMGEFASDCKSIADEYYPLLHDYLVDQLNSKAICSFLGMCSGPPSLFGAPIPVPAVKVVPAVQPVPSPVPVRVTSRPVSRTVNYASSSVYYSGPRFNFPSFDVQPNAYAPLAGLGLALPAAAALPLFAIG